MDWFPVSERNFDGIQFESLRSVVDDKFNLVHDELSDCYYSGRPFRNFGILSKEKFDKIHGLIFLMRDIVFHSENLKLPIKERIPSEQYNDITDESGRIVGIKSQQALQAIAALKAEGIELTI